MDVNSGSKDRQQKADLSQVDPEMAKKHEKSTTIAQQWQWETLNNKVQKQEGENLPQPFTPQSVHDALQAVKVDQNGDLILDHDALLSLDEALERIYNKLDADRLKQLRDLIEEALPGKVGTQTAKLVEDYNAFLKAKEEFSQVYEGSPPPYDQQSVASINNDEAIYSELKALRQVYLGNEAATKLFGVSDATAQFMFDSMKLELDKTMNAEQKNQRRLELQTQLEAIVGTAPNE